MRNSWRPRGRRASTARQNREHAITIAAIRRPPKPCGAPRQTPPSNSYRNLLRERSENSRPGANTLVEAPEIVLLVRRMNVVIVERKADQKRVQTQRTLEVRDDRDRGAR